MSRIKEAFTSGKAFIPYITCGDPDLATTAKIVKRMSRNGADLIELGIPFSDPTAEGPVMQAASLRALKNHVTTDHIFDFVRDIRREVSTPMVFMTYANVVFSYGSERFIKTCSEVGIDGLIILDIPYEEKDEFAPLCRQYDVELISLIAPATEDRIAMIAKDATGFIVIAANHNLQDTESSVITDVNTIVKIVRENTNVPCVVESNIFVPQQAKNVDGVIVENAIVSLAAEHGREAAISIGEYVKNIKRAIAV